MPTVTIHLSRLDYAIATWRTSIRHPVILFMFAALGLWLAVQQVMRSHDGHARLLIIAIVAGLMTATLVLFVSTSVTALAMAASARGDHGVLGEHTYRFVEAGLIESTRVNETLIKWGGVHGVERTRRYFYVRINRNGVHTIPRRFFADAAADDEFWKALQPLVAK